MAELYHYGIKGMKWGVRKSPEYSTFRSRRLRRAAKSATKDAKNLRQHGYNSEAKAVLKVANKSEKKAETIENKRKNSKQTKYQKAMRSLGKTSFATNAILKSNLSRENKRKALIEQEDMRIADGWNRRGKKYAKEMAEIKLNSIDDSTSSGVKEMKKAMNAYSKDYVIVYDVGTKKYIIKNN